MKFDSFDRLMLLIILGLIAAVALLAVFAEPAGVAVVDIMPGDGDAPPVTAAVQVTFNTAVEAESIEAAFRITPEVEGSFSWEGRTLTFTPAELLKSGEAYTVTVGAGVVTTDGRQLVQAASWTFTPRVPSVLYLSPSAEDSALWRIDAGDGEPVEVFAPEGGVVDFSAARQGDRVAVSDQAGIWLIDLPDGRARQVVACEPETCDGLAWSPDGATLAYVRRASDVDASGRVWLLDMATGETVPFIADETIQGTDPVWNPDGTHLAFYDPVGAIRVVALAMGTSDMLPNRYGATGEFSPDGSRIVTADIRAVGRQYFPEIVIADLAAGGRITAALPEAQEDRAPAWSPDGEWVAFARRLLDRSEGVGSAFMLFAPESGELLQVTDDAAYNNIAFAWEPGGNRVLVQRFSFEETGQPELWLYDMESGALARLVGDAYQGAWLP